VELIIIAAVAANRVIGRHNTIPWQIPEEMAHFKTTTMGSPLIMGRLTYESIGGPLPGRRCIVVSTSAAFRPHPACEKAASLAAAIDLCRDAKQTFVIGGSTLYQAALPLADTLIISWIGQAFAGDAYFPEFSEDDFVQVDSRNLFTTVPVTITVYRRIPKDTGA